MKLLILIYTSHILKVAAIYIKECHSGGATEENMYAYFRLTPNSKYLWLRNNDATYSKGSYIYDSAKTFDSAVKSCRDLDLDLGAITSLIDYQSMNTFIKSLGDVYSASYVQSWISGSDDAEEGIWKYHLTNKNITFQNFYGWNPQNTATQTNTHGNFIRLIFNLIDRDNENLLKTGSPNLAMMDYESSDFKGIPSKSFFCQYKKGTTCFKDSDEEKANKKLSDKLDHLGNTKNRKFYIARKQKTVAEAEEFCLSNAKGLLDLDTDSKSLHKLIKQWLIEKDLQPTSTSFILNGKNVDIFKGDTTVKWEWIDNELMDQTLLPYKQGKRNFGRCLAVGIIYNEGTVFSLARSICSLPRWCICYEDKSGGGDKKTTTESPDTDDKTTDSSTTDDPNGTTTEDPDTSTDDSGTTETSDGTTEDPDSTTDDSGTTEDPDGTTEDPDDSTTEDSGSGDNRGGDLYKEDQTWIWNVIAV